MGINLKYIIICFIVNFFGISSLAFAVHFLSELWMFCNILYQTILVNTFLFFLIFLGEFWINVFIFVMNFGNIIEPIYAHVFLVNVLLNSNI